MDWHLGWMDGDWYMITLNGKKKVHMLKENVKTE
jgi:hypothetical protein